MQNPDTHNIHLAGDMNGHFTIAIISLYNRPALPVPTYPSIQQILATQACSV